MATQDKLGALPSRERGELDKLVAAAKKALGDKLVSVVVHGSAARGDYRPGRSDVDVVVVVDGATLADLEALGDPLAIARWSARIEAMILEASEIAGAGDAFPLFYDELAHTHVVVHGKDAFAGVKVEDQHRRLRIEQELRDARIRLRRVAADSLGKPDALAGAVERKLRQLRSPLGALLSLRGEAAPVDLASVLAGCKAAWSVDVAPLENVRERPREAFAALIAVLDAAIEDVDAWGRS